MRSRRILLKAAALAFAWLGAAATDACAQDVTLLNVSYDPTRELYQEFNAAFAKHWKAEDRPDGHDQAVARRLRQAGARRSSTASRPTS